MTESAAPMQEPSLEFTPACLNSLRERLLIARGFDCSIYKENYVQRRISIRVRLTCCNSVEEYVDLLDRDDSELECLLKVLTIHVSQFFRNPSTFEKLADSILPSLFARCAAAGHPLTIWSVGCAGGEEPYSLAIILLSRFAAEMKNVPVRLLASDVDASVLEAAERGLYLPERLKDVPQKVLERFFEEDDGRLRLSDEVKRMVTFSRADLFDASPYPVSDLILCRNVLIYFEREEQERVIHRFAEALSEEGLLVIGRSETLWGEMRRRFDSICPVERIYRKR